MKKILVIDDELTMRQVLKNTIAALGYEVRDAEDGSIGLALCEEWKPDAIITDIFMPEKDGLETIRDLRKTAPDSVVIAMSGGGSIGDMGVLNAARAMGAATILSKPFDMSTLKRVLQEIFPEAAKNDTC